MIHRGSAKLDSVVPGSEEAYYMVAAYAFDAIRKLLYLHKAFVPFLIEVVETRNISSELKALVEEFGENTARIDHAGAWETTAREVEADMLRLYGELGDQHDELLEAVMASPTE